LQSRGSTDFRVLVRSSMLRFPPLLHPLPDGGSLLGICRV